jgi:hypothetical protein
MTTLTRRIAFATVATLAFGFVAAVCVGMLAWSAWGFYNFTADQWRQVAGIAGIYATLAAALVAGWIALIAVRRVPADYRSTVAGIVGFGVAYYVDANRHEWQAWTQRIGTVAIGGVTGWLLFRWMQRRTPFHEL